MSFKRMTANLIPNPVFWRMGFWKAAWLMFAFTPTEEGIRVFSMRKCNVREQRKFDRWVGR